MADVVEGDMRWCDGRWSEVRRYVIPQKNGVLVFVRNILYIGKMTAASESSTQHRGRRAQQSKSKKKIPLSPQVHTADIPRDLRMHMDKSA
jgi:hypothetical protein